MKTSEYHCPHCKNPLKPDKHIILLAKKTDATKGLILFEPELGDYRIMKHPDFRLKTGEDLHFFCPICQTSLEDSSGKFSEIILSEPNGNTFAIRFSGTVGEQATYKMQEGKIHERFGNDSDKY
jgi:hypothetical protein